MEWKSFSWVGRGGVAGPLLLISLSWAMCCSIGWGGSELRWPIINQRAWKWVFSEIDYWVWIVLWLALVVLVCFRRYFGVLMKKLRSWAEVALLVRSSSRYNRANNIWYMHRICSRSNTLKWFLQCWCAVNSFIFSFFSEERTIRAYFWQSIYHWSWGVFELSGIICSIVLVD